jgi:hypothetical protein
LLPDSACRGSISALSKGRQYPHNNQAKPDDQSGWPVSQFWSFQGARNRAVDISGEPGSSCNKPKGQCHRPSRFRLPSRHDPRAMSKESLQLRHPGKLFPNMKILAHFRTGWSDRRVTAGTKAQTRAGGGLATNSSGCQELDNRILRQWRIGTIASIACHQTGRGRNLKIRPFLKMF